MAFFLQAMLKPSTYALSIVGPARAGAAPAAPAAPAVPAAPAPVSRENMRGEHCWDRYSSRTWHVLVLRVCRSRMTSRIMIDNDNMMEVRRR